VLTPGVERMLEEAGRRLLAENRFRLFSIRLDGRTISSHLFLSAGTRTTYWLGGFDDALAKYHPAMLGLLAALEHEFEAGTSDLDLGTGDQPYKARLADSAEYVDWVSIVPRPRFSVIAGLEYAGRRLRIDAADRLPPAAKEVARAALRAKARLGEHAPRRPGAEGGPRQRPSP
jgi:CelD/BcsL family acetyltransferase involved in cellulose biosynthesis